MLPGGRAASPLPGRLPGAEGLLLAPPALAGLRGLQKGQAEAGWHILVLLAPGESILTDTSGVLYWVSLLGRSTLSAGSCSLPAALPLLPSLMCHRSQLFGVGGSKTPWVILSADNLKASRIKRIFKIPLYLSISTSISGLDPQSPEAQESWGEGSNHAPTC